MAEVNIVILDRDYRIACEPGGEEELRQSAQLVDRHMREIREGSKTLGNERIAVMAALNLAHELLREQNEEQEGSEQTEQRLKLLQAKIDTALDGHERQLPL